MVYLRTLITLKVIARTSLKVLLIVVTLLSFPHDTLGQTVWLKKYNLKTRNMAVKEINTTDSTVIYSWKTLIANWDSTTVRFKVKVVLKDSSSSAVYRHTTEEEYKLEAGEGMLAEGIMTLPKGYSHLISKFGFKFDFTPQMRFEAALMLYEALKAGIEKSKREKKKGKEKK